MKRNTLLSRIAKLKNLEVEIMLMKKDIQSPMMDVQSSPSHVKNFNNAIYLMLKKKKNSNLIWHLKPVKQLTKKLQL